MPVGLPHRQGAGLTLTNISSLLGEHLPSTGSRSARRGLPACVTVTADQAHSYHRNLLVGAAQAPDLLTPHQQLQWSAPPLPGEVPSQRLKREPGTPSLRWREGSMCWDSLLSSETAGDSLGVREDTRGHHRSPPMSTAAGTC